LSSASHNINDEDEKDGDCILQNGIDDPLDSDDSDEAQKQKNTRTLSVNSIVRYV